MEPIRTFVAIELDDSLRATLSQTQAQLKRAPVSYVGRWVAPDSVHLTLKFLGDIAADRVDSIVAALQSACLALAPFSITLAGLGCFPDLRRPRVIWIGVGGEIEALQQCQRGVEGALDKLGFPAERRPFQPHLTLARIKDSARPAELQELVKRMEATQVQSPPPMVVREVNLMRSELKPSGALYTRLVAVRLGG